ncbi:PilN domain-containing protein [Azospirillum sp. ST 5-10]|uniref:PilN domain-containing protein n=1 Tax=unclassified Azospirillum TaxID=2630922 RepID=UPI003F4A2262
MVEAGKAVGAFWSWWTRELTDAAAACAGPLRRGGGRLVLELTGGAAALHRADGTLVAQAPRDSEAALGRHGGSVDVRLGADLVLRKTIEVPAVAESDLRGLLAYEMDRQTPFAPDQIHFDFAVAGRSPDGGRLRIDLAVVLRREVEAALALAERAGLRVRSLGAAGDGGTPVGFDLLPPERRRPGGGRRAGALAAVAAAVLVAAAGAGLYRQAAATEEARRALAALRAQAESTAELRGGVERLEALDRRLRARKAAEPPFLSVLRELTDTLPDDTWLTRLALAEGRLDLVGASRTASALVGALEDRPLFAEVRFRAPLTLDPATGVEQFQISLQVPKDAGRP